MGPAFALIMQFQGKCSLSCVATPDA